IARRVLDICTSAASSPIKNCNPRMSDRFTEKTPPDSDTQPAKTVTHARNAKVSTGLLPNRSGREPRIQRVLSPPRNDVEVTSMILPSLMPLIFKNVTVNAVMPPYATDQPTTAQSNFLKGGYLVISSHGTRVLDERISSGISASGMRLRKLRLI